MLYKQNFSYFSTMNIQYFIFTELYSERGTLVIFCQVTSKTLDTQKSIRHDKMWKCKVLTAGVKKKCKISQSASDQTLHLLTRFSLVFRRLLLPPRKHKTNNKPAAAGSAF